MMIHCPWATMAGTADDPPTRPARWQDRAPLRQHLCVRSGMAEAEVCGLMRAETWLTAERAVEPASPTRSTAPWPVRRRSARPC